jgi:hypothetical protein
MNGGGAPSARRRQPKQQPAAREGGPTPPSRRSESCRAERGSEAGHHGGVTHDQAARNAAQPNPRSRCGWRSTRPAAAAEAADAAAADVCRRPQAWSCCPKPVASEHKTRLSDGYTVSSCGRRAWRTPGSAASACGGLGERVSLTRPRDCLAAPIQTLTRDEEEPPTATVGPLSLLGAKQKHAGSSRIARPKSMSLSQADARGP